MLKNPLGNPDNVARLNFFTYIQFQFLALWIIGANHVDVILFGSVGKAAGNGHRVTRDRLHHRHPKPD